MGYAREVLGIPCLWDKQIEIAEALRRPPYRVLCKSGHKIGKSHCAAWIINWWFDSFNPSGSISIAPRKEHLTNILWKDIRLQRMGARVNLMAEMMPKAPEMGNGVDHYARGITANKGEAVTGRHESRMLFVVDEAVGVDPIYFTTIKSMFKPDGSCAWLALCNPTKTTSQAYQEDSSGEWTSISLSCMEHPNIAAGLRGEPVPVPRAVTVDMIDGWVNSDWCTPVTAEERTVTDFEWPPASAKFWRPGPEMESRCLGIWPSQGTYGVWSDALWKSILGWDARRHAIALSTLPQLGCDVARFGDDNTDIHSRWGPMSLAHESHNGWAVTQTAGRLIELARELAAMVTERRGPTRAPCAPEEIPIKVDDDGVGGGVVDILREKGFNVQGVSAGAHAIDMTRYKNKRSELWFRTAGLARAGLMSLARLDKKTQRKLQLQAMAPVWQLDSAARRVVEDKKVTKKKLGHSPDGLDAMNLSYYESTIFEPPPVLPPQERPSVTSEEWREERQPRRKLFGR